MAAGGVRKLAVGANSNNRSDMHQPIEVPTGQQYGQAQQQRAWQQAMPLPQQPGVGSSPPSGATPGVAGMPPPTGPAPGELPPLLGPTTRPNEPVTAGVPSGPGPNALPQQGLPMGNMSQMLTSLARTSGSADLAILAQHAQSLGQ